jgi:hypothetical protein
MERKKSSLFLIASDSVEMFMSSKSVI